RRVSGASAPGTLSLCVGQGAVYLGMKRFDEAEHLLRETYETATKALGSGSTFAVYAAYNLAATFALQDRRPEALQWVETTLSFDPTESAMMEKDPDLANLHNEPEFQKLIAAAREKSGPGSP